VRVLEGIDCFSVDRLAEADVMVGECFSGNRGDFTTSNGNGVAPMSRWVFGYTCHNIRRVVRQLMLPLRDYRSVRG
jgi:hypothetical protein